MATTDVTAPSGNRPAETLRVAFVYHGDDIAIAGVRRVRMIVPPAVTPPPEKGQSGYWLEVRAADGRLLFHRSLHSPVRVDAEVYAHDRTQSIARVPVATPRGEFEALVPDLPDAHLLVLYGPPADPQRQAAPARELLRAGFEALRKLPPDKPPERAIPDRGRSER
jgi:hypothetical protein